MIRQGDDIVAEHARRYGRDQTIYDPWHYVPVLAKKPGALRNAAPFKQLALPPGLERLRTRLKTSSDGDRQMVKILTAITVDGLDAVENAAAEALADGVASADVVLNILARSRSAPVEPSIATPDHLQLHIEPIADAGRYDRLLTPLRRAA
ncbi:hypothetical protein EAH84_14190 [Sphingomonas oligophenolica]|uniref:IS21 family transposase n=1 Tax=Sphingomonas oligophenolica TaxID=301154 RepID=A0A502C816_9SPHN|nr:hypothetical protein EAH84_14190 [Sphingomonas oligophenolica]